MYQSFRSSKVAYDIPAQPVLPGVVNPLGAITSTVSDTINQPTSSLFGTE